MPQGKESRRTTKEKICLITESRSHGRKNKRGRKINAGWHERISKKRNGEGCRTEKRKRQRENRELYKKNKEHKKEWGAFVIKEQIGAGDMEKLGLHIEKLKFTRKEGEMENIIL